MDVEVGANEGSDFPQEVTPRSLMPGRSIAPIASEERRLGDREVGHCNLAPIAGRRAFLGTLTRGNSQTLVPDAV